MNKKQAFSITSFFLISFCLGNLLAAEYFPDNLNVPAREAETFFTFYSGLLRSMEEPPLWLRTKDPSSASYRLIYYPPKRGAPVVLRLDRFRKKWLLTVKQSGQESCNPTFAVNRTMTVSKKEVSDFHKLFSRLNFWSLPSIGALEVQYYLLDGSLYMFEAVEDGKYNVVERAAPKNSDELWISNPQAAKEFQKLREKEGYPYIDKITNSEVNSNLVAVCEFLVSLSGLQLEMR